MAADVGQASACAGLQSRWRDSYERCGRRAKAPPQAEACPTWTGGPTLARKCEVIPAPALSTAQRRKGTEFACASWSRLSAGNDGLRAGVSFSGSQDMPARKRAWPPERLLHSSKLNRLN